MITEIGGDCERHEWLVGQDVITWSSIAYVVVGAVMALLVVRSRLPRAVLALAVASIVEGIGSALFHAGSSDLGQYLHDVPLGGVTGFVAGWQVALVVWPGRHREGEAALLGWTAGLIVSAVATSYGATNLAVGVITTVIVASEVMARRRAATAVWSGGLVGLGALATGMWMIGRSGSTLCDSQAWLQPHGAWHVLSAMLLLAWIGRAVEVTSQLRSQFAAGTP
ncbi:MAG: ceramidase [Chloroflexota bacterium]|nr:ceramidase [Chloroflexota bacterium]